MRQILFSVFLMFAMHGIAQQAFLKEIDHNNSSNPVIIGTPDNGSMIYLPVESIIYKYDACGYQEWVKSFDLQNDNCCIGDPIQILANGNVGILTRVAVGAIYGYRLSVIDQSGTPVWSKVLSETSFDYHPYSLSVDADGNFLIYGIEMPVGGGAGFLNLIKVDPLGNMIWSKRVMGGAIWGATIATSDTGSLLRSGDTFIKMDVNGDAEWSSRITASATYNYLAAVEVSDGYIFTKTVNGSSEVGFFKMDKLGNNVWPMAKFTTFVGRPLALTKLGNGNFVAIFEDQLKAGTYGFLVVEFDKDLAVIKKSKVFIPNIDLEIFDFSLSQTGMPLVVGNSVSLGRKVFFAKLDEDYHVGCHDTAILVWNDKVVSSQVISSNVVPGTIVVSDKALSVSNLNYNDTLLCSKSVNVPSIDLGADVEFCENDTVLLQVTNFTQFDNYLWSTGETTSEIRISKPGKYWVEGSIMCENKTTTDTILVTEIVVEDPKLVTDTIFCSTSLILDAEITGGSYLWHDLSTLPTYEVTKSGNYYVDITFQNCHKRFSSNILGCDDFFIPNVFTPNNDGVNDYFGVIYDGNENIKVEVYNRWGILLFQTDIKGFSWDGTVNGEPASAGVYFYVIEIGDEKMQGHLTLIR
jgi:gliding motility-associated-like protein